MRIICVKCPRFLRGLAKLLRLFERRGGEA